MKVFKRNSKAVGAGFGAAVATIVVLVLRQFGVELGLEVEGAIAVLVTTITTWLFPANSGPEEL